MTGTLERLAALVVVPEPPRPAARLPGCCRAAVLGGRADVPPLAAALALTLRAADRCPAAAVALWGAELPPRAPAARAAAKLADPGSAAAASLRAIARGRLAWLALPREPADAIESLLAAAGVVDAPLVTALAGPRPAPLDDLVAGHDLVVVAAEPGTALARTALQRLASRGVSAIACRPLGRRAACVLAMAGVAATPRVDLTNSDHPCAAEREDHPDPWRPAT